MLRFRLRTLLIAVAILAVPMAWVGHSLRWIEQRRAAIVSIYGRGFYWLDRLSGFGNDSFERPDAPGLLWLFGERGQSGIVRPKLTTYTREELERLFPEAEVRDER